MNVAQKVREAKMKRPELYCSNRACLWREVTRDGLKPCPKHSGAKVDARQSAVPGGERGEQGAPASRSLPDSRPHPDNCQCHKCVMPF